MEIQYLKEVLRYSELHYLVPTASVVFDLEAGTSGIGSCLQLCLLI